MKTIQGDLLKIESGTLVHQVNCIGATGGLAGALRRRFPDHFMEYVSLCRIAEPMESLLGSYVIGKTSRSAIQIVHLFGQIYPGPNTEMNAVRDALEKISKLELSWPVFVPYKIGCGLGGGNWETYSMILEKYLPSAIIVRRPGD